MTTTTTSEASLDKNLIDAWTPDQEAALLKALIQYKPVGLHAHFRMISIRNHLLNSGTTDSEVEHTRIAGIWAKLRTLYDLEQLDEREDEIFTALGDDGDDDDSDTVDQQDQPPRSKRSRKDAAAAAAAAAAKAAIEASSPTESKNAYWRDFELPHGDDDSGGGGVGKDFEALMWERRLDPEGTDDGSDWDTNSTLNKATAGEAVDEPRSSPVGRGTRSTRKGRINQLKDDMEVDSPVSTPGRASRRTSKAVSEPETGPEPDEDQVMEDVDEDEEDEEDDAEASDGQEEEGEDKRGGVTRRGRSSVSSSTRGRGKWGKRKK